MEVKIQRSQLLSHLQRAQNIVERKTTLPILAHILMETESSALRLYTPENSLKSSERFPKEKSISSRQRNNSRFEQEEADFVFAPCLPRSFRRFQPSKQPNRSSFPLMYSWK